MLVLYLKSYVNRGTSMETPIDERFLSTAEASKVLGIGEQALRTLGREGAKGVYRIGKQFRFRIKEFCTAEVELTDRLDKLSQEVSELETTYREMVERFGLKDKGTQNAQTEYYSMLRALEIMKGEI